MTDRRPKSPAHSASATRILLVDDHPLIRQAVREIIEQEPDLRICGEAGDETAAMQLIKSSQPHLVLLDLSLGDSSGMEFIKWITKNDPATRVLILSMHDEILYAERVIRAGARGYLSKRAAPDVIIAAIRAVLAGDIYLNPAIVGRILQRLAGASRPAAPAGADIDQLSDREMETFELIGTGLGSREIAERLCISIKTVEAYRQRIKEKLGIATGPELARRAVEWVLSKS
jgi:DNA-binding NarL/FixJ family response regulator